MINFGVILLIFSSAPAARRGDRKVSIVIAIKILFTMTLVDLRSSRSMYGSVFSFLQFKIDLSWCIYIKAQKLVHKRKFSSVLSDVVNRKGKYWASYLMRRSRRLLETYPDLSAHLIRSFRFDDSDIDVLNDEDYHTCFQMQLDSDFLYEETHTDCDEDLSVEVGAPMFAFGSDADTELSSSSESFNALGYVEQTGEGDSIGYKQACQEKFKVRNARGKKQRAKLEHAARLLSKGELKKLVAALSKATNQVGIETIMTPVNSLKDYFNDFPFGYETLLEIVRTSVGLYVSTTPQQVIFHLLSSAMALGMSHSSELRVVITNLFMTPQAEELPGNSWHDMFVNTLKYWKDNDLLNGIKKSIIILISLGFARCGVLKGFLPSIESLLGNPKLLKLDAFDIVGFALSVYLFFAERIKAAYETKSLWGFFTPVPSLAATSLKIDDIHAKAPFVLAGRLAEEVPGETVESFTKHVVNVTAEVRKIMVNCRPAEKVLVMSWHRKLAALVTELELKLTEPSIRKAPFPINMVGASGVGKTMLIPVVAKAIMAGMKKPFNKGDMYYRTPTDKFWSGYHGQSIIVENEKNATKPQFSEVNENKSTLDIVDNSILYLNMADVDSKGLFTCRADGYISTTNVPDAQAAISSNEPAAILRRCIHVSVEVKPEFRKVGSDMLDVSKVHGDPLTDDCWLFTVFEAQTLPSTNLGEASGWQWIVQQHPDGRYMNKVPLDDLLTYIRYRVEQHVIRQNVIIENYNRMHEVELCEHGSGSSICRVCNSLPVPPINHEIVNMGHGVGNWAEVAGAPPGTPSVDALGRPYRPRHPTQPPFVSNHPELEAAVNRLDELRAQRVALLAASGEDQAGVLVVFPLLFLGALIQRACTWACRFFIVRFLCAYGRDYLWTCLLSALSVFDFVGVAPFESCTVRVCRSSYQAIRLSLIEPGAIQRALFLASQRTTWIHAGLSLVYYSLLPCVIYLFFGMSYVSSYVIGDACALCLNGYVFAFYRRLHARGANGALMDWAALRARPYLTTSFNYVVFAGVVGGALSAYKLLNAKRYVQQGGVQSVWNNERAWDIPYKPPTRVSEKQKTTTPADLVHLASKHIAYIRLYEKSSGKGVPFNAFPTKFGVWMAPGHAFNNLSYDTIDIVYNSSPFGANVTGIPIDRDKIVFIEGKDIALIYLVQTGGFMKDMTGYFTDEHASRVLTYVYRQPDGTILRAGDNSVRMEYGPTPRPKCVEGYIGNAPYTTFSGLCGAVQVSHTKTPSIVSFHIAGVPDMCESVCVPIFKSEIMAGLLKFNDKMVVQTASFEDMDLTDGDSRKVISNKFHEKSPLGYVDGHCKYFGTLQVRYKPVAAVKPTLISPFVEEVFGYPNIFGNPHDLRSWKPWYAAAKSITNPHFKDPTDLKLALEDYYKPIYDYLDRNDFRDIGPMSELETLSGGKRSSLYKHMNIKKSTGYPLRRPKSDYITPVFYPEDVDTPWHFEMNEELRARIDAVVERCEKGLRPNCIYSTALKVESKALKEFVDGEWVHKQTKPRVFYPAPVELVYLVRKYFLPVEHVLMGCEECEYAIGVNAAGPDWTKIAVSLQEIGDDNIPADVGGFDQSVTPDEFMPHVYHHINIAKHYLDYSAHDIMMMKALSSCFVYPIVDFDSDLTSFLSLHGSGGVLTAQFNSKIVSTRQRMPYYRKRRGDLQPHTSLSALPLDFRKFVKMYTFGDDSLPSVRKEITPWYNLVTFAAYWREYDVTITDAMKGTDLVPTLPLAKCDFLKRGFRWDEERGVWAAPLAEKSIMKRLHTSIPSEVLTEEEHCGEDIASSLRDYFEYGREMFTEKREKLMEVAALSGLAKFVPGGFPTYDDFVLEYNFKFKSVNPPASMRG